MTITAQIELAAWQHELRGANGRWILAFGDPTTAEHVVTFVPGVEKTGAMPLDIDHAHTLHAAMEGHDPGKTAVIFWRGYVPPDAVGKALSKSRAVQASGDLADFQQQIKSENPSAHYTVVGHSYGSLVAGEAAARHGMRPDDLVFAASPGVGVRHASELGMPAGHVYAALHSQDPIRSAASFLAEDFKGSPAHPQFGARIIPAETPGVDFKGQGRLAHGSYFEPISEALGGIAKISTAQQPVAAGLSITSQALELAGGWRDAWMHELRGPHGEWVKGIDPVRADTMNNWAQDAAKAGRPGEYGDLVTARESYLKGDSKAAAISLRMAASEYGAPPNRASAYRLLADQIDPLPTGKPLKTITDVLSRIDDIQTGLNTETHNGLRTEKELSSILVSISYARRLLQAAENTTDEGKRAGYLSGAGKYLGSAGGKAGADTAMGKKLRDLRHSLIMMDTPAALPAPSGSLRDKTEKFVSSFAPKLPGWLGGGKESWNGKVNITNVIDDNPSVLAQLDWNRLMTLREDVAQHIQTALDMKDEPVDDPAAFSVPLHEMIHGVVEPDNSSGADQQAYQDQAKATIEEGFTELGTVHHMPEYLDSLGISGRQTEILSDIDGAPVPNPDWEQARRALHARLRDEAADLRSEFGEYGPQWMAAQALDSAADYIDTGDTDDALGELAQLQHLGDNIRYQHALALRKEIQDFADIPQDKHATMSEYAKRLQDPSRVSNGQAWGHYPEQTRAAQEWVLQVAQNEHDGPFDASTPGSKDWKRVVELADEINRVGTAKKIQVMADQIIRMLGITDMSFPARVSLEQDIRAGFDDLQNPSGKQAFRNALIAIRTRHSNFSITGQAIELNWHDAWRHEPRGPHGEWVKGISAQAAEGSLAARFGRRAKSFLESGSIEDLGQPASPEIRGFTFKAATAVPDLLGGGNESFNGDVNVYSKLEQKTSLAEMDWNGTMKLRQDVAGTLQTALATTDGPIHAESFATILHELIHTLIPPGTSYRDNEQAYQDLPNAQMEEGFTELGAIQHAPDFLTAMGLADRDCFVPDWSHGAGTARQFAEQVAQPANIEAGHTWGHYPTQTAAALEWVQVIAEGEGSTDPARIVALADEINRQGVAGKAAAMADQIIRSTVGDVDPAERQVLRADLIGTIRKDWSGGATTGAQAARHAVDTANARMAAIAAERAA